MATDQPRKAKKNHRSSNLGEQKKFHQSLSTELSAFEASQLAICDTNIKTNKNKRRHLNFYCSTKSIPARDLGSNFDGHSFYANVEKYKFSSQLVRHEVSLLGRKIDASISSHVWGGKFGLPAGPERIVLPTACLSD